MTNNISPFVQKQAPEYLRESAPLFTGFLETYYKYTDLRNNSVGLIQNHNKNLDIDETLDLYVDKFYAAYGSSMPQELALDKRNFIKLLDSIYTAKGTEKAFTLLFKALFNETINILNPSNQTLKASDGVWERESFITTNTIMGSVVSPENNITFSNVYGNFSIKSSRFEQVTPTSVRFYYISYINISVEDNQVVFIKDGSSNSYVGSLIKSPSVLTIIDGGKSWQLGQVIIISGSTKNTIARITGIDQFGSITKTEILEYGHTHPQNQLTIVSPYPNKPVGSIVDINSTLVSVDPLVYHHVINIRDYTDSIYESISGISSGSSENSFFLEDYVDPSFSGSISFEESFNPGSTINNQVDSDITIEDWINSRAYIRYDHSNIVNTKGSYKSEVGHISNQSVRIQDNYYYQAFSYVIESTKDISDYKNTLSVIHPAGFKMFSNILKSDDYIVNIESSRTLSYDTVYILDLVSSSDQSSISFVKAISDQVPTVDYLTKSTIKYMLDDVVSVTSLDNAVTTNTSYDETDYFQEKYVVDTILIEIG